MAFLKWEDYTIFIVTLTLSFGIGLFYSCRSRKQKTTRQFILGDGRMATLPVALSLLVTYESGIIMLGIPAEVYLYGMQWYMSVLGFLVANLLTYHLILPSQWKLNITSIFQYFELRYNSRGIRLFVTILSLLGMVNFLGNVVFVPAITLEVIADISMEISIIALMGIVLLYTIIGGFTAVIWTDVFQAILMFGGLFAIIIKGTIEVGGVASTWSKITESGRFNMLDFNPDPTIRQSFWSLFVGSAIAGFRLQFSQATFQRIKASQSLSVAKRMFLTASVLFIVMEALAVLSGGVMFAYYDTLGCDPLVAKQVRNPNQLMAWWVRDIFHDTPCLPGLFLAALYSASLSTMSSLLSASSAMFLEDIVKPYAKPMSEKTSIRLARFSVFLFGGLGVLVAFVISGMKGPISQILDVTAACTKGSSTGIMMMGWLVPSSNALGAIIGGTVSFLFVGWIAVGKITSSGTRVNIKLDPASTENCRMFNESGLISDFGQNLFNESELMSAYDQNVSDIVRNSIISTTQASTFISEPQGLDILYSLSYKWLLPVGILLVLIVGSITSRLQARQPVDPTLVVPVCDYLCCCLPERVRRKFRCGVKYPGIDEITDGVKAEPNETILLTEDRGKR
ncbi:sodium-dependent multivitamin transporter-like [Argopecten irradians]|uniref:sodium-dependent multivitamin transporter-like n=1 Tax=Argopecten irradians TaxID=31199 RepID=UPI00371CAD69